MKTLIGCMLMACSFFVCGQTLQQQIQVVKQQATQHESNIKQYNYFNRAVAQLNLWQSRHKNGQFIIVDLNGQQIYGYQNSKVVVHEKVIIGRDGFETPAFSDVITQVIINPPWRVPDSLTKDYIDDAYRTVQYRLFDGNDNEIEVKYPLPDYYYVQQDAGPRSMLGKYMFVFPQQFYGIYIHDTPFKHLFSKDDRRFSAGCVRMQHPEKLFEFLLNQTTESHQEIVETLTIDLPNPVRVYLTDLPLGLQ